MSQQKSKSEKKLNLSIQREFTDTPGPRHEDLLLDRFQQALDQDCVLIVDLDGTEGYATSFLESAFGGLARRYGPQEVLAHIEFKSDDEPFLVKEIEKYIAEAMA
jgi:hypothetical protein